MPLFICNYNLPRYLSPTAFYLRAVLNKFLFQRRRHSSTMPNWPLNLTLITQANKPAILLSFQSGRVVIKLGPSVSLLQSSAHQPTRELSLFNRLALVIYDDIPNQQGLTSIWVLSCKTLGINWLIKSSNQVILWLFIFF